MFTHLHVHTEYSLLDGLSRIGTLVRRAKEQGMHALGLTDHGGLYGAVEFYTACTDAGIKPIIGCELYVADGSRLERRPTGRNPFHLTVIAQNNAGYRNLLQLVSKAHLEGFYYRPRIDRDLLSKHADGLIVLSGCPSAEMSELIKNDQAGQAEDLVRWYRDHVPHFYMELQRHDNLDFQDKLNAGLLRLAERMDVPLAATNDLHYVDRADAPLQDVLLCIQTNTNVNDAKRLKFSDDSYYLKSPQEMQELFADLPEALENTGRIADLSDVRLDFSTLHLPKYPVPGDEDEDAYLNRLCWQGFGRRLGANPAPAARDRLSYELDVISKTRYANYFLVVADIADFAHRSDIVFGVRGSAASSLALYCLGVTDINPLEHRLVFERFLNMERKEMPDIDMDFQDDRRDEAIQYVAAKYGRDRVAQIITFGTLGAKAAIRDVGRALAMPYADVDRIARLVPARLNVTIDSAMAESPELREAHAADPTLQRLIDTARSLEGVVRHASTHAAGVVISRDPLTDHVPLQRPTKGEEQQTAMTQYAMEPLAKLGLLKMDFLGLINYTILKKTLALLKRRLGLDIRFSEIPLDDPVTYELLASGETTAVFQLEGPGMRRYVKDLKPSNLGELAAMVALYRPGPMEHIQRFIDSKYERTPITYPHPALREILEETYGVIVYQDQVLHILRALAGYSLGQADIVRKAMGKKIPELMAQERSRFLAGAAARGYDEATSGQVFDLIQPFAGYAFNKAHAVSYALVAYLTAYFKANYPVEFMTCVLNAYVGNADKTVAIVAECRRLGIPVLPPDIQRSEVSFSVDEAEDGKPAIRFGLASIKNVGESAVAELVAERARGGPFSGLGDFCRRAGTHAANRRVLESVIKAGTLDAIGRRGELLASVESLLRHMQREAQLKTSGQTTMFNLFGQSVDAPLAQVVLVPAPDPMPAERSAWERELLGVALTTRAIPAPAGAILSREQLEQEHADAKVLLVGQVSAVRQAADRQGRRIAFVTLVYGTSLESSVELAVWSNVFSQTADLWREGAFVQVTGRVSYRGDEVSVRCDDAVPYVLPEEPAPEPTPTGPQARPWSEPPSPRDPSTAVIPAAPAPVAEAAANNGATNGHAPPPRAASPNATKETSVAQAPTPRGAPSPNAPQLTARKLLVRLTETDKADDDVFLMKTVLQLLLDYPGNDEVDLIITTSGKQYRVPMGFITTHYCEDLQRRLGVLLGRQDGITVLPSPISA